MVCRYCGTELENDSNFCKGCGKRIMISCEIETDDKTEKRIKGVLKERGEEMAYKAINAVKDALSEMAYTTFSATTDAVSDIVRKAMVKKGRKAADSLLKKMHLKPKNIIDVVKEKRKRRKIG